MSISGKMRRALKFSRDEWRTRGSQLLFRGANWAQSVAGRSIFPGAGHLRALGISRAELPDWWRSRHRSWFVDGARREHVRRYYDDNEEQRRAIIARADTVLAGRMPIFSHPPVEFTSNDRWTRDHILGVCAPRRFYGSIDFLDVEQVGDSKHVWEPNRFPWVYWLGQSYVVTQDERYAEKFSELVLDWHDKNRYPIGVNYCSALEMALRAYSLVWGADLFFDQLAQKPHVLDAVLETIWLSCRHVENNLSYYFAANTHLIGEGFGLLACGSAISEFRDSVRWRKKGEAILVSGASRQVHRDGTHRELSSCYQLYMTDFYVQASLIARQGGISLNPAIAETARLLARRTEELATLDGQLPQFNDCDGGRLTWFCRDPLDAGPSLRAARGFGLEVSEDLPGGDGYDLWMERLPAATKPARTGNARAARRTSGDGRLPDSGIATFKNASGDYILFRAGSFGLADVGYSHSHDAPTSVILHLAGQPVITDCGTGSYTQRIELRNRFRGAAGKNVLLVDGCGPSKPAGWFSWERHTNAALTTQESFTGGWRCIGTYVVGGEATTHRVVVSRSVTFFDAGVVAILTRWSARGPISGAVSFTLSPELRVNAAEKSLSGPAERVYHFDWLFVDEGDTSDLRAHEFGSHGSETDKRSASQVEPGQRFSVREAAYSANYGSISTSRALAFDFSPRRAGALVTVLSRRGPVTLQRSQDAVEISAESASFKVDLRDVRADMGAPQAAAV